MKNIRIFFLNIFIFFMVKFSVYLNRHVFIMYFCLGQSRKICFILSMHIVIRKHFCGACPI